MTPLNDIPFSSITWLVGSAAVFTIGVKSILAYRRSRTDLLKYMSWFALIMGMTLATVSVPSLFTLNPPILLKSVLVAEFFYYTSMIALAAIFWLLVLRRYIPIYAVTLPVGVLNLAAWLYAIPRTRLVLSHHFMAWQDPAFSTLVLGGLLIVLLVPVGLYFLRLAPRQNGLKAILNSVVYGLAFSCIGLMSGGFELVTGRVITPKTAPGILIFFIALLIIALWPQRAAAPLKLSISRPSDSTPLDSAPADPTSSLPR